MPLIGYDGVMPGWIIGLMGCGTGLEATLSTTPAPFRERTLLEPAAEVRILRGGMDLTLDEPGQVTGFAEALVVGQAVYDADYPSCMPAMWISLSDDARRPLASAVFCEGSGGGVVQFETLGARLISPEHADRLRHLVTDQAAD